MKILKMKRIMALVLSIILVFHSGNSYAYGDEVLHNTKNRVEDTRISSFAVTAVTGAAVTFYVGGPGASDAAGVTGRDSTTPFATIGRAAALMNNADREVVYDTEGREVYEIIVQGDTPVANETTFGDGTTEKVITLKGSVTGSAIVTRTGEYHTSMFTVTANTSLILGEDGASDNQSLILDGYRIYTYNAPIITNNGNLTLYNGVTIQNNFNNWQNTAGGILNKGTFNLNGGEIKNNSGGMGGGIFNDTGAALYINGGTITNNKADDNIASFADSNGGGIYNRGNMILSGGFISNNTAATAGGGIYNQGSLVLSGGFISNNNATTVGGGIYNNSSDFNINGGTISGNTAGEGAGLYNNAGVSGPITPQITSGSIDNNGSECSYGGGVYNNTAAALSIYGGIISNNDAYYKGGGIYNKGTLELYGGKIPEADDTVSFSGNTAEYGSGIYTSSQITMGGSFELPEADNIYLYGGSINLSEELSNIGVFYVFVHDSREGMQILTGGTALVVAYRNLFKLADSRLKVDDEGYTYLAAAPEYYYVGGENASDTNPGTESAHPFETLAAAIDAIGGGEGRIIIQSDLELNETLEIYSAAVTIMSDGAARNITRAAGFNEVVFFINEYGSLSLGNADNDEAGDTLIINGRGTGASGCIVSNIGTFKLYNGAALVNSINSAVSNGSNFYMYGGSISGTVGGYGGGGVINGGHFYMTGGVISNCNSESGGGVYNSNTFVMTGGTISGNTAGYGAGIINFGDMTIGGNSSITGNVSSEAGGGLYNYSNLTMTGGTISGNISKNGGAVYVYNSMSISGAAAIPAGDDKRNDIYIAQNLSHIVIDAAWTWEGTVAISADAIYPGRQVLNGSPELIAPYAGRFVVAGDNTDYIVGEDGRLEFIGEGRTYYVDAATGTDSNDGSAAHPFGTIHKAISEIEGSVGMGSIYLQSDISMSEPEFITGSITLLCDSNALLNDSKAYYTISPGDDFECYINDYNYIYDMFYINGSLTLGDNELSGDDDNPTLVFDGRGVDGIQENGSVIYNEGLVTIYPGVSMINRINNAEEAAIIHNEGTLSMLGGTMHDNEVVYGAVWNTGRFTMTGGKIYNNMFPAVVIENLGFLYINGGAISNNVGGYVVYNQNEFTMENGIIEGNNGSGAVNNSGKFLFTGGSICNNTASSPAGSVYNSGEFTLDGGNIYGNTGRVAGGILNTRNFFMKSGSIYNNFGRIAGGVYNTRTFNMSGGIINGNTDSVRDIGIYNPIGAMLIMSGEAIVTSDNVIFLSTDSSDNNSMVTIGGPLAGTFPSSDPLGAFVIIRSSGSYTLGVKVLSSEEGYTFSEEDLAYFRLADDSYAINLEGNIGRNFRNADIEISYSPMYYDGTGKQVDSVTVTLGPDTLIEGTDYEVTYENNIPAGDRAAAIIRGIGQYAGKQIKYFTILTPTVESIITTEPVGLTRRASDGLSELQLAAWIPCTEISVRILGSGNTCYSPVSWVWDTSEEGYDEYNVKGGVYRFKAQFNNPSLDFGSLIFNTTVTVELSVLVSPTFSDIVVRTRADEAATAAELGAGILPTMGTYIWTDGDTHTSLDYCIVWDSEQTLDRTELEAETTFTGTLTYDPEDIPEWATLPGSLRVSRTVGVTAKDVVEITNVTITNKTYDGNPVSLIGTPSNTNGYSGSYEYRYIRTDVQGYDSAQAPKDAGVYVLTISIPEEDENFTGYIEIPFIINKKEVRVKADDKYVMVGSSLPVYTYSFAPDYGLIGNDTFSVQPALSCDARQGRESGTYLITASGAVAGANYNITYQTGTLTITAQAPPPPPTPTSPPIQVTISDFVALGEGMGRMQVVITQPDSEGNLQADFILPEEDLLELLLDNTLGKPIPLLIPITSEKLLELIKKVEGGQVNLNLVIPDSILSGDFDISDITLDPEILKAVKETGKDITFSVKDENGNLLYSWTFLGEDLNKSGDDENPSPVNLALSVSRVMEEDELNELLNPGADEDNPYASGLIIDFNHVGMLPVQSAVRIYVGNQEGLEPGDKIFLYYHDPVTGKLATLPYSSRLVVEEDGYITVDIVHCSEYIILPKAADPKLIVSLRNQIRVSPLKVILYADSSDDFTEINIELPDSLQLVEKPDDITSGKAVGAVTVSYRSGNKEVATVGKDGVIRAVGTGTTTIYVKFTLYSGKTKTVGIKVTVKEGKRK